MPRHKALREAAVGVDLEALGITPDEAADWMELAKIPEEEFDRRMAEEVAEEVGPRHQAFVEACITQHLPADALVRLRATEREQRASLQTFLTSWTRRRKGRP